MPEHIDSGYSGEITWLGLMPDRAKTLQGVAKDSLFAGFDGINGDSHMGVTRASCGRTQGQHPRGTTIRNTRQFTVLCAQELARVADEMNIETLDPALIGANLVVDGVPDFSHIPPSSRLIAENGTTLVVDVINLPCVFPGKPIESVHINKGKTFKPAAKDRRGITAWVLCEGMLRVGDVLRLHVPAQRQWTP
ncbi:MOSC domain-containing protein [Halocynthiibacter namhaensis]|uniref:MOSC domain-containing protein n=1 Tax=Halocynthiibacter namhaensis TaxID=1290553 RepID=UPI000578F4EA|nr:MOSC domain-containing protein [Halocynthiibacter namhaensis]